MERAFDNFEWKNRPSVATPLSAENLNRVNAGLGEVDLRVIDLYQIELPKMEQKIQETHQDVQQDIKDSILINAVNYDAQAPIHSSQEKAIARNQIDAVSTIACGDLDLIRRIGDGTLAGAIRQNHDDIETGGSQTIPTYVKENTVNFFSDSPSHTEREKTIAREQIDAVSNTEFTTFQTAVNTNINNVKERVGTLETKTIELAGDLNNLTTKVATNETKLNQLAQVIIEGEKSVNVTLSSVGWINQGDYFEQTVTVADMTTASKPLLVSANTQIANAANYNKAYGIVSAGVHTTNNGSCTFRVLKKPAITITVGLKGV